MTTLNIVSIIENNPLTCITNVNNNKLIEKINNNFTNNEQHLFIASFYSYLNYNKNDFVIDIDDIWKWIGFARKDHAKRLLEKHFIKDIDYKVSSQEPAPPVGGAGIQTTNLGGAGLNKEKVLMKINTFKKLCLKANTKKADEIHEYYIKLEEVLQEVIMEESKELKEQLLIKEQELEEKDEQIELKNEELILQEEISKEEQSILLEETILEQFPINTQCVYYGSVDNKDTKNANLIKFGMSNNLQERVKSHKKTYKNFKLLKAFKVKNQIEIENCVKKHNILKKQIRSIIYESMNYRELIAINDTNFSLDNINLYFKEIIEENEYNLDNYKKLLVRVDELTIENIKLKEENNTMKINNEKITKELLELKPDVHQSIINKSFSLTDSKNGNILFIFKCDKKDRYFCNINKTTTINVLEQAYKSSNENGSIIYTVNIKHSCLVKLVQFLLKSHLFSFGNHCYEGSLSTIKDIYEIIKNIDDKISISDLDNIKDWSFGREFIREIEEKNDPEIPKVRKAKRPINQINKDTGEIIKTFDSMEEAGRNILMTGTSIGISIRNKTLCGGFIFRYANVSHEDQYTDQKVIKINCSNGEKIFFDNIASAAKDAKLSAPGLRNRILTDVHVNGYHWIFDKNNTHYTNNI